jgi:hypothetical protein
MTWRGVVLAFLVALAPAANVDAAPIHVLSVVGGVQAGDRPLVPGVVDAGRLEVQRGATVQALLPCASCRGAPRTLALSVAGRSVLRLGGSSEVAIVDGEGAVRLAGGGALQRSGWRVALEDDATVVLQGRTLHVLVGRASLRATPATLDPVSRFLARFGETSPPMIVNAGRVAWLDLTSRTLGVGRPSAEVLARLDALQPPAPWTPPLDEVSAAEVKRARRWTQQQRQAAREAASCGCTESRGPGAGPIAGRGAFNPLERTTTIIRVKVTDVPRRLP